MKKGKNLSKKATDLSHNLQPIQISVEGEVARGVYSNVAIIRHTKNEFIFDFLLQLADKAQLVSRVIISPEHASRFLDALKENLSKHKSIPIPGEKKNSTPR